VIRLLTVDDAEELTALYVENREFLLPFEPRGHNGRGLARKLLRINGEWRHQVLFERIAN